MKEAGGEGWLRNAALIIDFGWRAGMGENSARTGIGQEEPLTTQLAGLIQALLPTQCLGEEHDSRL